MERLKSLAFTLAEVLIVLGIIGLIAEMTLPVLISSTEKQVEVTSLKKFYAAFDQGLGMIIQDNGCNDIACTGIFNGDHTDVSWQANIDTAMRKAFRVVKSCNGSLSGCIDYPSSIKYLDKSSMSTGMAGYFNGYSFLTTDGFLVALKDYNSSNCQSSSYSTATGFNPHCAYLYVDINGAKTPNQVGRDIFSFSVGGIGGIYPNFGIDYASFWNANYASSSDYWKQTASECGTAGNPTVGSGVSGDGCAARIMENGWKMDY